MSWRVKYLNGKYKNGKKYSLMMETRKAVVLSKSRVPIYRAAISIVMIMVDKDQSGQVIRQINQIVTRLPGI